MIKSYAFDVESLCNVFSVVFVDLKAYLRVFKDCGTDALSSHLTVKEIKERLDTVPKHLFYFSDTNDEQFLSLIGFLNNMYTETDENGKPVRYDLYAFNNSRYDDVMIAALLARFNQYPSVTKLIQYLKRVSEDIIRAQADDSFYTNQELKLLKSYTLPYLSVDVMQVYGLHASGVDIDKDTGERHKYGKSLKQTAINLKWHELKEFILPPINEEEAEYYRKTYDHFRGASVEYLNSQITNDFDRYVLPKYIDDMMRYNVNDVYLVCEMVRQKPDEIRLRYSITSAFNEHVISSARPNIADKLTVKFYAQFSGLREASFSKGRTIRTKLSFDKIIFPHIQFKTPQLQDFLARIKKVSIYRTNKSEFCEEFDFMGTRYTVGTGGIHSQDIPRVLKSDDKFVYLHHDYTSYYPSIMISYGVHPKHLHQGAFVNMLSFLKNERVKCKHTKDSDGYVIPNVPNKVGAEALKIVINSIYGKLGSEFSFLYDRFAQMQVTINGELMTLTLIEELELNGIHVVSANTDGIIIKLPRDKFDVYKDITDRWNVTNKMGADYEEYKILVSRDVNSYFDIQADDSVDFKGALDPKQYIKDLKKGYNAPVVALSIYNYFAKGIPVMTTLREHKDILDFCKTQNVGRKFGILAVKVNNGKFEEIETQRNCRYYISNSGCILKKVNKQTNDKFSLVSGNYVTLLNTLDDAPIETRNINYKYYYDEAYKIINPIMLGFSSKASVSKYSVKSDGKRRKGKLVNIYSNDFLTLFDNDS